MRLVHAGPFPFRGFGGCGSRVTVEVYVTTCGRESVTCLIDGPHNTGTSSINAAEILARAVSSRLLPTHAPDAHVRFLDVQTERYDHHEECPRYSWLTFKDAVNFRGPQWTSLSPDEALALLGESRARRPH